MQIKRLMANTEGRVNAPCEGFADQFSPNGFVLHSEKPKQGVELALNRHRKNQIQSISGKQGKNYKFNRKKLRKNVIELGIFSFPTFYRVSNENRVKG